MLKKLKDWWNRHQKREQQLLDELKRYSDALVVEREQRDILTTQRQSLVEETVKLESQVEVLRTKVREDEDRRNSSEPWVDIKGERIDPVKGIQLDLDWNDAFIQFLKDGGLKGRDEEEIVQRWLALLYHNLIERLEQRTIDNTAVRGTANDYV